MIIQTISNKINYFAEKGSIILLGLITLLTFLGIVCRYIFGSPIIWLYELTLVLFSWTTFLGISIAFKHNDHIHLDIIYHKISKKSGAVLSTLTKCVILIFLVIITKDGVLIVIDTAAQKYNTIPISTAWFYGALLISAVFSIIHIIDHSIEECKLEIFRKKTFNTEKEKL